MQAAVLYPSPRRYGLRVTEYEPAQTETIRIEGEHYLRPGDVIRASTDSAWQTIRFRDPDDILNPDHEYWPDRCAAVSPKPKTEEGIKLFYDRHPELRGIM